MTAKFISDRARVIGVDVENQQRELQPIRFTDYTPQFKATSGQGKRNLLNIDEVMRLPKSGALIFLRREKRVKIKKFDYSKHPDSKLLQPCNDKEHVPEWRAKIEAARKKNTAPPVPANSPQSNGSQSGGSKQTSAPGKGNSTPVSPTSENSKKPQSAPNAENPNSEKSGKPTTAPNANSGNEKGRTEHGLIPNSVELKEMPLYPLLLPRHNKRRIKPVFY